MAQISDQARQDISDAASQYLAAYNAKQIEVTQKQAVYSQAVVQDDAVFDGQQVPFTKIESHSRTARQLYSDTAAAAGGYDAQMAAYAPTIVEFLGAYQSGTAITFPDLNQKLTVSGGNVVVSAIQ